MEARLDRLSSADPRKLDALVAAALFALAQAEVWLGGASEGQRPETAAAAAVMTAALAFRRTRPLATLVAVMAAVAALAFGAGLPNAAFLLPVGLLAIYSAAAHLDAERAVIGLGLALAAVGATAARTDDATVTDLTAPAILFTGIWVVGRALRSRRERSGELERRTAQLEREQERRERAAAEEERTRIARELHDIVAHRVSAIVIQAESGLVTADEPDGSRESLTAIRDSGRQALGELRRLLGLLRDGDEDAGVAPQPSLAAVDELVRGTRAAGLPVEVRIEGAVDDLPQSVDVAAYRLVQEALTNALRHAGTDTTLTLCRTADRITVEVANGLPDYDGRPWPGAGQGLAGMRERVRIFGGRFDAGAADGSYVVRASLPIAEPPPR
jgi:signal transduction histidine kinase